MLPAAFALKVPPPSCTRRRCATHPPPQILSKLDTMKRLETARFCEERDVLMRGDSRWITKMHMSFKDTSSLYLLMDYYSGGDLVLRPSRTLSRVPAGLSAPPPPS